MKKFLNAMSSFKHSINSLTSGEFIKVVLGTKSKEKESPSSDAMW
jgi:hypothetical protein